MQKFEVERLLQILTGGSYPSPGDVLIFHGEAGWKFASEDLEISITQLVDEDGTPVSDPGSNVDPADLGIDAGLSAAHVAARVLLGL